MHVYLYYLIVALNILMNYTTHLSDVWSKIFCDIGIRKGTNSRSILYSDFITTFTFDSMVLNYNGFTPICERISSTTRTLVNVSFRVY
jgi:hypothetical protein